MSQLELFPSDKNSPDYIVKNFIKKRKRLTSNVKDKKTWEDVYAWFTDDNNIYNAIMMLPEFNETGYDYISGILRLNDGFYFIKDIIKLLLEKDIEHFISWAKGHDFAYDEILNYFLLLNDDINESDLKTVNAWKENFDLRKQSIYDIIDFVIRYMQYDTFIDVYSESVYMKDVLKYLIKIGEWNKILSYPLNVTYDELLDWVKDSEHLVYREMFLPYDMSKDEWEDVGVYWTYEKEAAKSYWERGQDNRILMTAKIDPDDIQLDYTLIKTMWDNSVEREIHLNNNVTIELIEFKVMGNSYVYDKKNRELEYFAKHYHNVTIAHDKTEQNIDKLTTFKFDKPVIVSTGSREEV